MLERERGHRQHADAVLVDEERILIGAVMRAAILDDAETAGRDLVEHTVIELDDRVGHILLESVAGQRLLSPLAGDHHREVAFPQPPEQPAQLRAEDGFVVESPEE